MGNEASQPTDAERQEAADMKRQLGLKMLKINVEKKWLHEVNR